jgi:hypothetical protein
MGHVHWVPLPGAGLVRACVDFPIMSTGIGRRQALKREVLPAGGYKRKVRVRAPVYHFHGGQHECGTALPFVRALDEVGYYTAEGMAGLAADGGVFRLRPLCQCAVV